MDFRDIRDICNKAHVKLLRLEGVFSFGKVKEIVESLCPAECTQDQIREIASDLLDDNLNCGNLEFVYFGNEEYGKFYKTRFSDIGDFVDLGHGKILHKSAFSNKNQISDKKNAQNTKPKPAKECDAFCK